MPGETWGNFHILEQSCAVSLLGKPQSAPGLKGSCVRSFCVNWFQFALCSALCILMFSALFRSLWDIVLLSLEKSYRNRESPFQTIWIFASFRNFCCLGIDCPGCLLLGDLEEEIKKNKVRNFVFSKAPALLWVGHGKGKRIVFILWERSTTVGRNTVTRPPHPGALELFCWPRKVTELKANFSGEGHGCPAPLEPWNTVLCYNGSTLSILKRKMGFHLKVFPPWKQVRIFQVVSLFWIIG